MSSVAGLRDIEEHRLDLDFPPRIGRLDENVPGIAVGVMASCFAAFRPACHELVHFPPNGR